MLVDTVGFELLGGGLSKDVESALRTALAAKAVFPKESTTPIAIFRQALADSIRNIESHPRGELFQQFLLEGPYEGVGEIPTELIDKHPSDAEVATAITFIYSHMVNSFKGAITELLAASACSRLLKRLQREGELSANARLYVGDSVGVRRSRSPLM